MIQSKLVSVAFDSRYNNNNQCLNLSIILVLVKIRFVSEQ